MNENENETYMVFFETLRASVARLREQSTDPRADLPLLATLVIAGCRASEVLRLTRADVDGEQCPVRLRSEKDFSCW